MNHFWTEPKKEKSVWIVEKRGVDGKTITSYPFHTHKLAEEFLQTITITINGEVMYSGVAKN